MNEFLEQAINKESKSFKISTDEFIRLANIGCHIGFSDDLETRFDKFGGESFFDEEKLSFFLKALVEGGSALEDSKRKS